MLDNKEVMFHMFCHKCKFKDLTPIEEPCNTCMETPCRSGTYEPINFRDNTNNKPTLKRIDGGKANER